MAEILDCKGMKCPRPVLKVAIKANSMNTGSVLEVYADCPSFSNDIKKWCEDSEKVLISCVDQGDGSIIATIQF